MKYFRKHNLLLQQEQTEIDAFPEYLKCKEFILGKLLMFQIMCTPNVKSRQELDSSLKGAGLRVLWVPQCQLQKDLGRLMLGL